jgi:hypothetical protein
LIKNFSSVCAAVINWNIMDDKRENTKRKKYKIDAGIPMSELFVEAETHLEIYTQKIILNNTGFPSKSRIPFWIRSLHLTLLRLQGLVSLNFLEAPRRKYHLT